MYVAGRAATRAAPAVFRAGIRTAGRPSRQLPRNIPAIAILIPHRAVSTEPSSNQNGNFPPPGFNTEQAKKPLSKDEQSQEKSAKLPNVGIPSNEPTATPKTDAEKTRTLSELATEKAEQAKKETTIVKKEEEEMKLTVWQKVKKEAAHYWDGTKLLATEVRISSKLALKMAAGYELTRREYRQVKFPTTRSAGMWLTHNSCKEPSKTSVVSCRSLFSSSSPLQNFSSRWR
jgi:LETM1 and EF-hand domain-containing protein 1